MVREVQDGALYADASIEGAILERGLADESVWSISPTSGNPSGRGPTKVIAGTAGRRWRLKRLRRGGVVGALWRDQFPSARRPFEVLRATLTAAARGVPTARPIALLLRRGAGGLVRGFFAVEELEGYADLATRTLRHAIGEVEIGATMATIRSMHDHGVVHPDLNLGNVMLRGDAAQRTEVSLIDFDRARFLSGPAPFAVRQAAVRRLERSCAKITGSPGPMGPGSEDLWYGLYAAGDGALAARFGRGRPVGRWVLALHRAGWKRTRS